jgi:hypothetical protein
VEKTRQHPALIAKDDQCQNPPRETSAGFWFWAFFIAVATSQVGRDGGVSIDEQQVRVFTFISNVALRIIACGAILRCQNLFTITVPQVRDEPGISVLARRKNYRAGCLNHILCLGTGHLAQIWPSLGNVRGC